MTAVHAKPATSPAASRTAATPSSASLIVGVLSESAPERRVALTPDGVHRLRTLGCAVVVVSGAGTSAGFPDVDYETAGATIGTVASVMAGSDALVCIHAPDRSVRGLLKRGQTVVGLLRPATNTDLVRALETAGVTVISLDGLPRTLSSAQSMDALTSQANVAGYKAVLVAANAYGGYLPMLMTAAGTVRPAAVLVIGAGVAGLQAIGTARRLGAVVTGYDVRDAARSDIASTGAKFLELGTNAAAHPAPATAAGGYARAMTAAEQADQQSAMVEALATFDIVITTAQVPGATPPVLVSKAAIAAMRPGSVIVDLAASALGGNVEGSVADQTVVSDNSVTVIGAGNLPSSVPAAASTAYSRNISALLGHLVTDGRLHLDLADEITSGVVVTPDRKTERARPADDRSPSPVIPAQPNTTAKLITTGSGRH